MYVYVKVFITNKSHSAVRVSRRTSVHVRTRDGLASSGSKGHTPQNTLSLSGPTPDWPARTDFNYARAQADADFLRAGACVCARDTWSAREAERHDKSSSCCPHKGPEGAAPAASTPRRVQRCPAASSPDGQARGTEQAKGMGQRRKAAPRCLCCSALTAAPLPPHTSLADGQAPCRGVRAGPSALAGGLRLAPRPSAAPPAPGSRLRGAHPLTEAILELPRQRLHVTHAARALVLPANHLLAPVVRAHPRRRVPAGRAHLLLNVEGGATAPPARGVRLLDLVLQGVLGTHSSSRDLSGGTWHI